MSTTQVVTVKRSEWTALDASASVFVQLRSTGKVIINITDAGAPANNDDTGVVIQWGAASVPSSFGAGGLAAGDVVYLKSGADTTEDVTVIQY